MRGILRAAYSERTMDIRPATAEDAALIGELLHDFNVEFEEPTPPADELARRIAALLSTDTDVLLADTVGLAVLRFQPSIWTANLECYLAELYVRPEHRGVLRYERGPLGGYAIVKQIAEYSEAQWNREARRQ